MFSMVFILLIISILYPYIKTYAEEHKQQIEVTWYGHAVIAIYDGTTRILIDPFFTNNPTAPISWEELPPIDYILLTHDHSDHLGDTIAIAQHHGAKVSGVFDTMEALVQAGLPRELLVQGTGFNIGGMITIGKFTARMIPAMHTSSTGLPVGYIITALNGFTIYHAGDTAPFGDMKLWASYFPIDVAILPIGGYFTSDAFLTMKSIELLTPTYVLPIHYATFPLLSSSSEEFITLIQQSSLKVEPCILTPGDSIKFP